jgi:hypothetical protein
VKTFDDFSAQKIKKILIDFCITESKIFCHGLPSNYLAIC